MLGPVEELMRRHEWAEAASEIHDLLVKQPYHPKLLGYLGLCHYHLGKFEVARKYFIQAIMIDPNFLDAAIVLAKTLNRLQLTDEAQEVVQTYLARFPGNPTLETLKNTIGRAPQGDGSVKQDQPPASA